MRIEPNQDQPYPIPSRELDGNGSRPSNVNGVGNAGGSGSSDASVSSASDSAVTRLVEQLRELPEVRHDVVAQAREKVARGDYLTDQAARDVSASILNSGALD